MSFWTNEGEVPVYEKGLSNVREENMSVSGSALACVIVSGYNETRGRGARFWSEEDTVVPRR